jgi:hypothetical protein
MSTARIRMNRGTADLRDDLIAKVVYTGRRNPPKSVGASQTSKALTTKDTKVHKGTPVISFLVSFTA